MKRNTIRSSAELASTAAALLAADDLERALWEVLEDRRRKEEEEKLNELVEELIRSLCGSVLTNRKG